MLSFRLKKQTSKNVVDTVFNQSRVGIKRLWFMNFEWIFWSHEPKICEAFIFHEWFFWNMILLLFISTLQYLTNPYQFTIAYMVFIILLIFIIKVTTKENSFAWNLQGDLLSHCWNFISYFKSYYFPRNYFCKGNFKIVSLTNLFQLFIYLQEFIWMRSLVSVTMFCEKWPDQCKEQISLENYKQTSSKFSHYNILTMVM